MPFVYAFFSWIATTAIVATVTGSDAVGMVTGVAAGVASFVAARRRARRERAIRVVEGLQAMSENLDPVAALDPTLTTDLSGGVIKCFDRDTSRLGWAAFEAFRTNWMQRPDISPRNPIVMRGGLATYMLYGDEQFPQSSAAYMAAFGMGYGIGLAEQADKLRLDDYVTRPWQEVMALMAALLYNNPADPSAPVPLHLIVQIVTCGYYFGRTGHQPSAIQATLTAMDEGSDA